MWVWVDFVALDAEFFFFFFSLLLFMVAVDLTSGWWWRWWVDVVVVVWVGGCGGRRCWVEKERDTERGRIKNDKEKIFK